MAARIITNSDSRAHSAPLLASLGLEALSSRRNSHVLTIVHDILAGNIHPHFKDFFSESESSSSTPRTTIEKKRFSYYSLKLLNDTAKNTGTSICALESSQVGRSLSQTSLLIMQSSSSSASIDIYTQLDTSAAVAPEENPG